MPLFSEDTKTQRNLLIFNFYHSTIESILTYGCTVWYSSCTDVERKDLQRVVKTAQRIIDV